MGLLSWLFGSSVQAKPPVDGDDDDDDIAWVVAGRGKEKNFPDDCPDDHANYLDTEVVGVFFRKQDVINWADGRRLSLDWQCEPENEHDRNAVMIFGLSARGRAQLGYVQREIAARIVKSGMFEKLQPRLTRIYQAPSQDDDLYCLIEYEVTGPKELKAQFLRRPEKPAAQRKPVETHTRLP